jgi:glycosyltransferase involved in cell wall biosynthesis
VELYADVPDVRPYMAQCAVMAVPLRIGGGSRLKILESIAAGLPVVSTRIGAEGLCLRPGIDFTQADSPSELIEALVNTLNGPGAAYARAHQARQVVAGRYDWKVLADRLERVWEKACNS